MNKDKLLVLISVALVLLSGALLTLKPSITGYTVYNCSDNICKEGERVAVGEQFKLNYGLVCSRTIKFEAFDVQNNITEVHLVENGIPAGNSPAIATDDCNPNGCRLEFTYQLYPGILNNYQMRFNKAENLLYLENTTQKCPVYCGDNICESAEDFMNCRQDCMHREGQTLKADASQNDRYFATNFGTNCEAIFYFDTATNSEIRIRGIDRTTGQAIMFYSIEYIQGSSAFLNHSNKLYKIRFNSQNQTLLLEDTDTGCGYDCSTAGEKGCYNYTAYNICGADSNNYLSWTTVIDCGANKMCRNGECLRYCTDECSAAGQKGCYSANMTQMCGNFDTDACFEWGNMSFCQSWYECKDGDCVKTCKDECKTENRTECFNDSKSVGLCGNFDPDPCLEYRLVDSCDALKETCSDAGCQCLESWTCEEWSLCENSKQTRICADSNNCGTEKEKLATEKTCVCVSQYSCGRWSDCESSFTRRRLCNDFVCGKEDKIETESCSYVPPVVDQIAPNKFDGFEEEKMPAVEAPAASSMLSTIIMAVIGLIILLGGSAAFVFYEMSKSKQKLDAEKKKETIPDDVYNSLKSYMLQMQEQGYTKEQIKLALLKEGWTADKIEKIFGNK
jgi:hypothetical protein